MTHTRVLPVASVVVALFASWGKTPAQTPVWAPIFDLPVRWPGGCQMVFDTARRRIVAVDVTDFHEHDRAAWRRVGVGINLQGRAFVFDEARRVTVSFGGFPLDGNMREWNGSSWTVRSLPGSPTPRRYTAMAFDRARSRIVLFGGRDATGQRDDTWEYDGTTWTPMVAPIRAPAREEHVMAFDQARGVTVLYGGLVGGTYVGDTWEWDGVIWTAHGTGPVAVPRVFAYDETRARMVLAYMSNTYTGDTWERTGTSWALVQAGGPMLPGYLTYGGTFDSVLGRVVTMGQAATVSWAVAGAPPLWSWDGATWVLVTPHEVPPFLDGAAQSRCPLRQSTLRYGSTTDVTWEWRGGVWRRVPTVNRPGLLNDPAMAEEAAGTVLMFGGSNSNVTWRFTGTDWLRLQPANAPSPRSQHGMAADRFRGRIVLFGGLGSAGVLGDTWEWDGSNWLQMTPAQSPQPRANPALSFEWTTGNTLLFGGGQRSTQAAGDFWSWNGSNWQQLPSGLAPRGRGQMDFDPVRQRTVLAGGFDMQTQGFAAVTSTHEWDGTAWRNISSPPVSGGIGATGGYDPALRRYVLFGYVLFGFYGAGELGAPSLAAVVPVGAPCAGSSGDPRLETPWVPRGGNPHFGLRLCSLLPGALALFAIGQAPAAVPFGGCTLHLVPQASITVVADAAGVAICPLPLPATAALHGATFLAQGAGLDPRGPFAGLAAFSNGLQVTID